MNRTVKGSSQLPVKPGPTRSVYELVVYLSLSPFPPHPFLFGVLIMASAVCTSRIACLLPTHPLTKRLNLSFRCHFPNHFNRRSYSSISAVDNRFTWDDVIQVSLPETPCSFDAADQSTNLRGYFDKINSCNRGSVLNNSTPILLPTLNGLLRFVINVYVSFCSSAGKAMWFSAICRSRTDGRLHSQAVTFFFT